METISPEKRLQLENQKLARELKRLKKDNEVLRMANDQALRTQTYIQKDNMRQAFYTNQLLKTSPYILILTDERLRTVMTSDAFFRFGKKFSSEELRRGVSLRLALSGILSESELDELLLNMKYSIRRLAGAKEKWYGLDTSSLILENVPLITGSSGPSRRIQRKNPEEDE